jgi:peptidyl-prolyl cis-trans isomerase D
MRLRSLLAAASACVTLAACDGLREALTAHVDVAAKAGGQELSVQRLADLLGNSKLAIPVTKQNAQTIASLWADYQLMGIAAARGDSLTDKKAIDEAAAGFLAGMRLQRFTDSIGKTFTLDSATEAGYNAGKANLFAARHILFGTNPTMTAAQKDSVRRAAEAVRVTVTDANFGEMAAKHSTEPNASQSRGALGVFPRGMMVKEFGDAVAALKPGEISGLVETQFGYHIVQRLPYAAAREQYLANYGQASRAVAESTYLAGLEAKAATKVRDDAPAKVKSALKDPSAHRKDTDQLASYNGGSLTVGRFITWVNSAPNAQQIAQQLQTVPDSAVKGIVERIVRNELMLKEADRMKIDIPAQEKEQIYAQFGQMVKQIWEALGVSPASLRDSAKTDAERQTLVAQRVESFVDRLVNGQAQPVSVPPILSGLLADKYDLEINQAGIDKAVEAAQKIRVVADSTRAAQQPGSAIPMPGAPGQQPPAGGAPPAGQQPQAPPAGGQAQPGQQP